METPKLYHVRSSGSVVRYLHTVAAMSDQDARRRYEEAFPDRLVTSVMELSDVHPGIILESTER